MIGLSWRCYLWSMVLLAPPLCGPSRAELRPVEIFLVYNRNVPASREIARYYVQRRGVPAGQMIGLDLPADSRNEQIARADYEAKVRAPLRAWLRGQGYQDRIRCLVTVYGVPLRVGPAEVSPADRALATETSEELNEALLRLEALAVEMARAAQTQPATRPDTRPGPPDGKDALSRYEKARDQALARLEGLTAAQDAQVLGMRALTLLQVGDGLEGVLGRLRPQDPAGRETIAAARADALEKREQLKRLLKGCPRTEHRREAHELLAQLLGLHGLVAHLHDDQMQLSAKDTQAALDSELSLLWWDDYPPFRWVLNPMSLRVRHLAEFQEAFQAEPVLPPVVMVARLDAPTPAIVRRMIDDAMAAEQAGLAGKVYIDGRGFTGDDGYGQYDANLRDLAMLLRTRTNLDVHLNDGPALFAEGECPDAALYCGWYSLGKYVPAFTWARGAVAVHIASSEAVSLHKPETQYWCKRMLEEGVAATLGPVAEPYLSAFPLPRDFFGLLLTGRYSLVECYYHTASFNSWMMTLLGDPLYNPFGKAPLLRPEDVFPNAWYDLPPAATAPATAPATGRASAAGEE